MSQSPPAIVTGPVTTSTGAVRRVVGGLLVLPAAVALLVGYGWPSLRTGWQSMFADSWLRGGESFVYLDNYRYVASSFDSSVGPVGGVLWLALGPLLLVLLVAPLLALGAHYAGRPTRLATRLLLTVPMAALTPVGLAIGWLLTRVEPGAGSTASGPAGWFTLFGLVTGVAVTAYLAALRGRPAPRPAPEQRRPAVRGPQWAVLATLVGLALITVLAVSAQSFTYSFLLDGGQRTRGATPVAWAFERGVLDFEPGGAYAMAVLVLVPVMLLGVAATLVLILTGLRLEVDPFGRGPDRAGGWTAGRVVAALGVTLGGAAVLAVSLYGMWPWLSRLAVFGDLETSALAQLLANTWLPPIVSTVIGVGLAAIAGFGIGALRPLGRHSELLLLPFAPWLFVAVGPLALTKYGAAASGAVTWVDTWFFRIIPVWVVVPALLLFALLFRGLAHQMSTGARPRGYGRMLLAALPMLGLVGGVTYLLQAQSLLWGLLASRTASFPAPVWVMNYTVGRLADPAEVPLGLLFPLPLFVLCVLGLALLQIFYLDRIAIRAERLG